MALQQAEALRFSLINIISPSHHSHANLSAINVT